MTYKDKIHELTKCTFLPGSWDKRFVRDMMSKDVNKLTQKQKEWIDKLHHKYRRQISRLRCQRKKIGKVI